MKDITATTIGALTGSGIGYAISKTAEAGAHAAVKVRPKLGEVGAIDAMLTDHLSDWLFYNHPTIGMAILVILLGLIGAAAGFGFNDDAGGL